ncbi:hypothetical protein Taro_001780, partial [Colocasia esculenta]|nr:hypothetical protein [Colocasia esculenta]
LRSKPTGTNPSAATKHKLVFFSFQFNGFLLVPTSYLEWRKTFQLVRTSKDANRKSKMLTMSRSGPTDIKYKADV